MVQENRIEEFAQRGKEVGQQVQHGVEDAYHRTEDMVRENPLVSTLTVFSAGVGLGLLLTCALLPSRRRQSMGSNWYETYDQTSKQIADTVCKMIPESLKARMS